MRMLRKICTEEVEELSPAIKQGLQESKILKDFKV